jgi:hypothetical protein
LRQAAPDHSLFLFFIFSLRQSRPPLFSRRKAAIFFSKENPAKLRGFLYFTSSPNKKIKVI